MTQPGTRTQSPVEAPDRPGVVPVRAAALRSAVRWGVAHGLPRVAVRRSARAGDLQSLLLSDPAVWREPYDLHERVRAAGPLVRGRFSWVSASHAVAREVLGSADFGMGGFDDVSSPRVRRVLDWAGRGAPVHPIEPPSMLAVDGPDHTRYRKLVSRVFTPRSVEGLRGQVQATADGLLDDLARAPEPVVDVVRPFAGRLPVTVICDLLGVPVEGRSEVREFEAGLAMSLEAVAPWRQFRTVEGALRGFDDWVGRHLEHLRRAPGEDLLSRLVTATEEGQRLTERELRATAGLLVAAGFETTVNLLGSAVHLLLANPDQLQVLRAEPDLWPQAVEEVLRLESPVQIVGRQALRDTAVAGQEVRAGSRVVLLLGAANRDPAVFEDPARFDVRRENVREHLAFSAGRHFCLGVALARLEGEVGLRSLFERFPGMRAEPGARRTSTRVLRGWEHLPVRLR
ncbi:hypothetical protein CLV92_11457 [Kineococcus xinjiangensis]|uniref:Cytochrome P450 n=1 Tax=Kineococcus xinjiangensis TaxID=512762 RepID=A0A2S6IE40_9ACTN|nr:cytochrome P450 [Kineococcus xinjiangensis]PPK92456.1 hypothetical protein CLV92_11457 [Kineococcus xinjiangensis]